MLFYRLLLRLYPKSFRAEYGKEMRAVFARERQAATGSGVVALMLRAVVDTVTNASRVHADILRQDLRYSLRSLRRTPGFSLTAVVVAGLGIGATTATFSIADHVLIRPLPFPEPDRLVRIWQTNLARGLAQLEPSPPNYHDWKRLAKSFEDVEAYIGDTANLTGLGEAERVFGARVTGGAFRLLRRHATIGRVLVETDIASGQNPIVISDRFWRSRFAANPNVLGRTLTLDDVTQTIVGVMPPDFRFPARDRDFWRPFRFSPTGSDQDRRNHYLQVFGRLVDGVSLEQARAEMNMIGEQLQREHPEALAGLGVYVGRERDEVNPQSRLQLWALAGASLCVLLIACINLANLLLSRALARRTEFAVRAAVGASVDRLVRQVFTDSFLLAGAGGLLGVVIALTATPLVVRLVPSALPIAAVPPLDLRMLGLAAVITIVTALAFGLSPALRVCRRADSSALKDGGRTTAGSAERLRSVLVAAEIMASVVLLVSAGLLVQALLKVRQVDPGFRADNVLTLRTTLPRSKYARTEARRRFYRHVLDDVHRLPGVRHAAYISFVPMTMRAGIQDVLSTTPDPGSTLRFRPLDDVTDRRTSLRYLTPGYFAAIGTPMLQGRDVRIEDNLRSPLVAVVSESFVRRYFANRDPIGQSFGYAGDVRTIVGVVGDVRVRGLERDSEPQVYLPETQMRDGALTFYAPQDLVISASVPVMTLAPAVRAIVRGADPQLPITNLQLLSAVVDGETASREIQAGAVGAFAVLAFVLAAIGIHGLLAFAVSARTREIGVRMALGAERADIMRLVLGRSARLAAAGAAAGVPVAYAAGRSMQSMLAGVDPANPQIFAAAIALSVVMAIAGSALPAWRAGRVDPIAATRTPDC